MICSKIVYSKNKAVLTQEIVTVSPIRKESSLPNLCASLKMLPLLRRQDGWACLYNNMYVLPRTSALDCSLSSLTILNSGVSRDSLIQ